ncbi:DUF6934 family protein [Dyadobacter sp. CY326]|uniref:DUF6934 family protein n=1 Tax=Dyadobacter sp. CY326 TaxID=2907300 RepID=UPI0038D4C07B
MHIQPYPFAVASSEIRYEFLSISPAKKVSKVVLLSLVNAEDIYNLALLDLLEDDSLCDITETRNGDFRTVMSTVMAIVKHFLEKQPLTLVMFSGTEARRHRLYRILLTNELEKITKTFRIWGRQNGLLEVFQPNVNYDHYLIEKL